MWWGGVVGAKGRGGRFHRSPCAGTAGGTRMTDLGVLGVDDDFMVTSIHTRFVWRTPGFTVVGVAATAATAKQEIERLRPDLVLLDVHLPDMTGIDLLRTLRAEGNDIGVVMVTAAREADTMRAASEIGRAHV